jgi:chemotaxis protein MotB
LKERWLITYADMITVLLIFFIVMYALSKVDVDKFKVLTQSMSAAFGASGSIMENPGPSIVPDVAPDEIQRQLEEQVRLEEIRAKLETFVEETGLEGRITVTTEERGIVISFQDEVLFALGSAELMPEAREIIHNVAKVLSSSKNYIRIEGHTDDLPIRTSRYPSNWELSAARATGVVQELIKIPGFPPHRLSAVAYGEYRPRVPNTSEESRQQNRRVDLVILRDEFIIAEPNAFIPTETGIVEPSYVH